MVVKTKMLTVAVHADFARTLDDLIKQSRMYSSRSEFLKDAIRNNIDKLYAHNESLRSIHEGFRELAAVARKRGYKGGLLSRAERARIADEYMKENGWA